MLGTLGQPCMASPLRAPAALPPLLPSCCFLWPSAPSSVLCSSSAGLTAPCTVLAPSVALAPHLPRAPMYRQERRGRETCWVPATSSLLTGSSMRLRLLSDHLPRCSPLPSSTVSAVSPPCPQVDELMRQELKNLRLAVDREDERPLKTPKVEKRLWPAGEGTLGWGGGGRGQ